MIKNNSQILIEGRYDSFAGLISNDIFKTIKETEGYTDGTQYIDLPYESNGKDRYYHKSGSGVEVDLRVRRTNDTITHGNKELPCYINTYIATDDVLVMEVTIDETYGREFYEEMFYKINEDVRHELEHYLQDMFDDRQQPNIPNTSDYETVFSHHMDPSEVEALVQGFYRRAKLEKKPLDVIMIDDLNKDVESGDLTQNEFNTLLQTWITYARRRLPNAKFSSPTKRRFSFKK